MIAEQQQGIPSLILFNPADSNVKGYFYVGREGADLLVIPFIDVEIAHLHSLPFQYTLEEEEITKQYYAIMEAITLVSPLTVGHWNRGAMDILPLKNAFWEWLDR